MKEEYNGNRHPSCGIFDVNQTATCSAPLPVWHAQCNWSLLDTSKFNVNVIESLDQDGMLFLSDLSRQECSTFTTTSQLEFDVPDSPTGHGREKGFRRQRTHDGDRSPDVSDTRSHCFPEYAGQLNTCSHLTECLEKPDDTSRTSPGARRTGSNRSRTSQSTRMDQTKDSALLDVTRTRTAQKTQHKLVLGRVYQAGTVRFSRIRSTTPKRMTMNDANNATLFLMG